jgi:hypothetical protein
VPTSHAFNRPVAVAVRTMRAAVGCIQKVIPRGGIRMNGASVAADSFSPRDASEFAELDPTHRGPRRGAWRSLVSALVWGTIRRPWIQAHSVGFGESASIDGRLRVLR